MAYLLPPQILDYYDSRRVLELLSDTGSPVTVGTLNTVSVLTRAIDAASAEVDAALQVGRRYDRAQLESICSAADAPGAIEADRRRAAPIKELVAHLVFGRLMARRGYSADKMRQLAPMYDEALAKLDRLSSGEAILDVDANKSAGVPTQVTRGSQKVRWSQFSSMFGVFPDSPNAYLYPYGGC